MKPFLSFLLVFTTASSVYAQNEYDTQWKSVDALIQKKNLPRSALAMVKKIYARAKREGNDVQVLKALVYQTDLGEGLTENNELASIAEIEKELPASREPFTSLLSSMAADLYLHYFEKHRWQLYNRTDNEQVAEDDVTKWTRADFHRKISALYLASLRQKGVLQQTTVDSLRVIVVKGNAASLRPTLYDLLAHKALGYFESDEQYVTKPESVFSLNEPAFFGPAKTFASLTIQARDTASLLHKALLVHQDLLAFHAADKTKDALLDEDIRRIEFVDRYATMTDKDSLYEKALLNLMAEYAGNGAVNGAGYLLAKRYNERGERYRPFTDTLYRYERVKAVNLLTKMVADSSVKNEGWADGYNLLQEIKKPSLQVTTEKVNLPSEPFRLLVKYKNLAAVTVNLLLSSSTLIDRLDDGNSNYWKVLAKQKPVKQWRQSLPQTGDYQEHLVEIKVDGLPAGDYFLVLSDGTIDGKKTTASASHFWVSNISYVNRGNDFFVLHRKTGEPLAGAAVTLLNKDYNEKLHKAVPKTLGQYTANGHGFFRAAGAEAKFYYSILSIAYKGETLALDYDSYLSRGTDDQPRSRERTAVYFFTDRSVYRPGQTVYFKAILVRDGDRQAKNILVSQPVAVYLYDTNGQKRDSLKLRSNDYGSVAGQFLLPANLLNGNFSLRSTLFGDDSRTSFSVEEYKRPKFYAAFEKTKEEYKIGDSVRMTLMAKAFAGNAIGGASVKYRVVRRARTWWKYVSSQAEQQILNGENETGAEGKLTISFKAMPGEEVDSPTNPVFNYTVTATVTDINGETHSATETVSAGYASLLLVASVPDKLSLDSFKTLSVQTHNLQGETVQAPLNISFFKLRPEPRLLRKRFWARSDQFVMSKDDYVRYFPFDEYADESNYETWPQEKAGSFATVSNDGGKVNLQLPEALTAGHYLVRFTARDKAGKEVKTEEHIELFSLGAFTQTQFLWTCGDGTAIKPGEEHVLQLASAAKDVCLVKESDRGGKGLRDTTRFAYERLNEEKKLFRFGAGEADRGGYSYSFLFVKENRVYQYDGFVNVAWSNKDLKVALTTFRDKTEPGSKETWKVKVSDDGGKKAAAEVLASMYDASLDEFRPHKWSKPYLWRTYSQGLTWTYKDFRTGYSDDKQAIFRNTRFSKIYDRLLFDKQHVQPLWWLNPLDYAYRERGKREGEFYIHAAPDEGRGLVTPPAPEDENKVFEKVEIDYGDFKELNGRIIPSFNSNTVPVRGNAYQRNDGRGNVSGFFDGPLSERQKQSAIQPRKNFSETAFFFPFLTTGANGDIEISFTAPDALTKWKLQAFAHTKDLAFGLVQKELITQKSLMVQPAVPRFVRQKDSFTLQAKITNLSDEEPKGEALLQLFDAATNEPVGTAFGIPQTAIPFAVKRRGSTVVNFPMAVPEGFNSSLTWRITASAKGGAGVSFSDGEEATLPVLPNKILLTETVPLVLRGTKVQEVKLDKLLQSAASTTLQHQSLTVEATTNPAWYVVQALPYLMEFPYECAEQTWNRYYANALASVIVKSSPKIEAVFRKWKADTTALLSNLQKNEELKSVLLQETPWVVEAQNEAVQKRNLAALFDEDRMKKELYQNAVKLRQMQKSNGAFPWFSGGPDNRYITQYILTGLGRLLNTKGRDTDTGREWQAVASKALAWLDGQTAKDYQAATKNGTATPYTALQSEEAQYLYMRSFFPSFPVSRTTQPAMTALKAAAQRQWAKASRQVQAMIALALFRGGDAKTTAAILASLKETAIVNEERGVYWKGMEGGRGFYWEEAPVETAALLIEAFAEAGRDDSTVAALQTWLLQQKQTVHWGNTKATADACFAILARNPSLLNGGASVSIRLGAGTKTPVFAGSDNDEAGTGYFKKTIAAADVRASMGNISVQAKNNNGSVPVWANVYWQYFEAMDKATPTGSPLSVARELWLEKTTDKGVQLSALTGATKPKPGDKLRVRIQLSADRDLQYVHLKDMRASCLEPLNVFSGYRWQNGTGYYEETKDAGTNFFFDFLPKGSYVFEYPVYVAQSGDFSSGVASVQCMYAPQVAAHSEGGRVTVRK